MVKAKKSTKLFNQKRKHEHNKSKLGLKRKKSMHKGGQRRGSTREWDERKEEGKKQHASKMTVDEFLDQDFGDSDKSDSDAEEDSQSLSSLEEADLEEDITSKKVKKSKKGKSDQDNLKSEIEDHKKTLGSLKERDPEFYNYLQQTDQELLDFKDDASESEEESEEENLKAKSTKERNVLVLDEKIISKWCEASKSTTSVKPLQNLLKAYRIGCHYGDDEKKESVSYRISNSNVFNKLMLFVLKHADDILRRVLMIESQKPEAVVRAFESSRWKKVGSLVKSYFGNSLHLLSQVKDASLAAFILQRLRASLDLFPKFLVLNKKLLKCALNLFGSGLGEETFDRTVRIQSILVIRSLAHTMPHPFVDNCFKGIYRMFQSCAKFSNAASMSSVQFMEDCIVEVYGVNLDAAYKQAFLSIRELAIVLRNALNVKTKEAYLQVYTWQTILSLDLWERMLSKYGTHEKAELYPLVYPLVQILLGTCQLVATTRYLPLRFHVMGTLNRLAKNTSVFIPLSPIILEGLHFSELSKKPTGVGKSYHFRGLLKVSKPALRTTSFQEQCVKQVILLLSEHLSQWSCHIAFPELAFPTILQLKNFLKTSKVEKFRRGVGQLQEALERNGDYVLNARQKVDFSPKDLDKVWKFMQEHEEAKSSPLIKFHGGLQKQADAHEATADASVLYVKDRKSSKKGEPSVNLSDEDEDMDYDDEVLPQKKHTDSVEKDSAKSDLGENEDRVEDLEMSSDEDADEDEEQDNNSDHDDEASDSSTST